MRPCRLARLLLRPDGSSRSRPGRTSGLADLKYPGANARDRYHRRNRRATGPQEALSTTGRARTRGGLRQSPERTAGQACPPLRHSILPKPRYWVGIPQRPSVRPGFSPRDPGRGRWLAALGSYTRLNVGPSLQPWPRSPRRRVPPPTEHDPPDSEASTKDATRGQRRGRNIRLPSCAGNPPVRIGGQRQEDPRTARTGRRW